jgi:hypothetical protein
MPFTASIDTGNILLGKSAKLLFPISLAGQKGHTGDRLTALVNFAKQYNSTILLADALQRHNLQDKEKALVLGDKFLEKHKTLFKGTVLIQSAEEWEKYKDNENVVKLIRWNTWGEIKSHEFKQAFSLIEANCQADNSLLVKKMNETAQHNLSKANLSSSIDYQKEENAYLMTFSEFDYHCYPAPLNPSQTETVKLFSQQYKIPVHKSINFNSIQLSEDTVAIKRQRHAQSLPLALRMLVQNVEDALKSTEISESHKKLFKEKVNSIFTSDEHENNMLKNNGIESVMPAGSFKGLTFFPTYQPESDESKNNFNNSSILPLSLTKSSESTT